MVVVRWKIASDIEDRDRKGIDAKDADVEETS